MKEKLVFFEAFNYEFYLKKSIPLPLKACIICAGFAKQVKYVKHKIVIYEKSFLVV